jgi:hypothetical protein
MIHLILEHFTLIKGFSTSLLTSGKFLRRTTFQQKKNTKYLSVMKFYDIFDLLREQFSQLFFR